VLEAELTMQQIELSEQLQQVLQRSERRVQVINYVLAALLAIVLGWALYASWRNAQQAKIESLTLVEDSVRVLSPAALCPGDTLAIHFALDVRGTGTVILDDFVQYQDHTVKFSRGWRDWFGDSGRRIYEDRWVIPSRPEMPVDESGEWIAGDYVRTISVAASNAYVSRYTEPVSFPVGFTIREGC
jgi:hypothetical protein